MPGRSRSPRPCGFPKPARRCWMPSPPGAGCLPGPGLPDRLASLAGVRARVRRDPRDGRRQTRPRASTRKPRFHQRASPLPRADRAHLPAGGWRAARVRLRPRGAPARRGRKKANIRIPLANLPARNAAFAQPASDRILDHATVLLAALRSGIPLSRSRIAPGLRISPSCKPCSLPRAS